jgi:hypothetical protein
MLIEKGISSKIPNYIWEHTFIALKKEMSYPARISASVYVLTLFSGIPRAFPRTYVCKRSCNISMGNCMENMFAQVLVSIACRP